MESFTCPLKGAKELSPDKAAIVKGNVLISYKKLDQLVDQIADRLSPFEGKKIGIFSNDSMRVIILLFACLRKNIIPIFFPTRWPKIQVKQGIESSDSDLFLHDDLTFEYLDIPSAKIQDLFEKRNKTTSLNAINNKASIFVYTSSSTSFAKACKLNIHGLLISAKTVCNKIGLEEYSKVYLSLPLYHIAGISLVLRTFLKGGALFLPNKSLDDDLVNHSITHVSLVPTQLYYLLQLPVKKIKKIKQKIKCMLIGGGPMGQNLLKEAKNYELPIYFTYGMTETSSSVFIKKNPLCEKGNIYLGMPLSHMQVALTEEKELLIRGTSLFEGYYQENELVLPLKKQGWFSTKDLANYCPKKGICILGRKDHQFISGGENIRPEQIEKILMGLEGIIEAIVVPVKDDKFGQRPVAFVQTKLNEKKILQKLEKKLPKYQIPTHFFNLNTLDLGQIKRKRKDLITMAEEKISKKNSPK